MQTILCETYTLGKIHLRLRQCALVTGLAGRAIKTKLAAELARLTRLAAAEPCDARIASMDLISCADRVLRLSL